VQQIGPFSLDGSIDVINLGVANGEDVELTPREACRIADVLETAGTLTIRNVRVQAGMDAEIRIGRRSLHLQRMLAAQLARGLRAQAHTPS